MRHTLTFILLICCLGARSQPVADFGYTILCGNVTFTDSSSGAVSWFWDFGNGSTSTIQNPFFGLGSGTHTVTLIVTDNSGATDTVSKNIHITPFYINTRETDSYCRYFCNGTVTIRVFGGRPPYTFTWSNGLTSSSAMGLCPGGYTVTAVDADGCISGAGIIISQNPVYLPIISNSLADATCGNCDGELYVAAYYGLPPYSYSWSNGDTVDYISGLCPGTYAVTATDSTTCYDIDTFTILSGCNACDSLLCHDADVCTADSCSNGNCIYTPVLIDVTVVPAIDTIELGDSVTLTAVASNPGSFTYTWTPSQGLSCNNCLQPVASPQFTTEYHLFVTDMNGCVNTAGVLIVVLSDTFTTGTRDFSISDNIKIYFQPGSKEVIVQLSNGIINQILITDILGHRVYQSVNINVSEYLIEIQDWSAGIYLACILTDKGMVRKKILLK